VTLTYPNFPGQKPTTSRTPIWQTVVKESTNGRELRLGRQPYPRWQYSLSYEFLRNRANLRELSDLTAFYSLCRGQAGEFLFIDDDGPAVIDPDTGAQIGTIFSAAADQPFATGDGSAAVFQLTRQIAGSAFAFVEPVWAPTGTPKIKNNGAVVPSSSYSIGETGLIQFASAPAAGRVLAWTGTYAMRCRFSADTLEFKRMLLGLHEVPKVDLLSILP